MMHSLLSRTCLCLMMLMVIWVVGGCGGGDGMGGPGGDASSQSLVYTAGADGEVSVNVIFRERPGNAERAFMQGRGARVQRAFHRIPVANVKIHQRDLNRTLAGLRSDRRVRLVEPDGIDQVCSQTIPWGVAHIGAPMVHSGGNSGAGVRIAVQDTGIDYSHADLQANYYGGYNFITDTSDPLDDHGHGTHVAGTVAAVNNSIGVLGVGPAARLYAVKTLGSGGGTHSQFAAGMQWAIDNGMQIINYSAGGASSETKRLACQAAYDAGILIVAAAGNDSGGITSPAVYDTTLAVGSVNSSNVRASTSNYGPQLDVMGPGVSIYSTMRGGSYGNLSGTSMATAHVSGLAALIIKSGGLGASPTPAVLMQRIRETADDLGDPGYDYYHGYGIVNALSATAGSSPTPDPEPEPEPEAEPAPEPDPEPEPEPVPPPPPAPAAISGRVTDSGTGQGIAGATVRADTGDTAQTDSSGYYLLPDVTPGLRQVTASASGYDSATRTVSAEEGKTVTLNFTLALTPPPPPPPPGPGSISGVVRQASNGSPLNNATVRTDTGQSMRTGGDGRFLLTSVPSGTRALTCSRPSMRTQTANVQVKDGETAVYSFYLSR